MSTSRAPVTTSGPARSPETWTVALRFSAWIHEPQGPSSLSSSCPPFQPSFLFLVVSDFPVIKLNFVLLVKSSLRERVFGEWPCWRVCEAGPQPQLLRRGQGRLLQHSVAVGAASLTGCCVSSRSSLSPSTGFTSDAEPPCLRFL